MSADPLTVPSRFHPVLPPSPSPPVAEPVRGARTCPASGGDSSAAEGRLSQGRRHSCGLRSVGRRDGQRRRRCGDGCQSRCLRGVSGRVRSAPERRRLQAGAACSAAHRSSFRPRRRVRGRNVDTGTVSGRWGSLDSTCSQMTRAGEVVTR